MSDITVIGVGNILLGDDGVGVHLVNYLRERKSLPEDVALIDGDIDTFGIASFLSDSKFAIIIDACNFKESYPGSFRRIEVNLSELTFFKNGLSIHSRSLKDAILLASIKRNNLNLIIYAIEINCVKFEINLTAELKRNFPLIEDQILVDIRKFKEEEKNEQKSACH